MVTPQPRTVSIESHPKIRVRVLPAGEAPAAKRRRIESQTTISTDSTRPFLPTDLSTPDLLENWLRELTRINGAGIRLRQTTAAVPPEIIRAIADDRSPDWIRTLSMVCKAMYVAVDLAFPLRRAPGLIADLRLTRAGDDLVSVKTFDRFFRSLVQPIESYTSALLTPLSGRLRNFMLMLMLEWTEELRSHTRQTRVQKISAELAKQDPVEFATAIEDYTRYRAWKRDGIPATRNHNAIKVFPLAPPRWFCHGGLEDVVKAMPESEAKVDVIRALLRLFSSEVGDREFQASLAIAPPDLLAERLLHGVYDEARKSTHLALNQSIATTVLNLKRFAPSVRKRAMLRTCDILVSELPGTGRSHVMHIDVRCRWPDVAPDTTSLFATLETMRRSLDDMTEEDRHEVLVKFVQAFAIHELSREESVLTFYQDPEIYSVPGIEKPSHFNALANEMRGMPEGWAKDAIRTALTNFAYRFEDQTLRNYLLQQLGSEYQAS